MVITPERMTVAQGETAVLRCSVSGTTSASSFTWSKVGDDAAAFLDRPSVSATDDSLTLEKVDVSDRGVYVCTLDGSGGYQR